MRESAEKVKIQRTRKRIYEMDHEEPPETEVILQESAAVMSLPATEIAVEAVPETAAAEESVCSKDQSLEKKVSDELIRETHQDAAPEKDDLRESVAKIALTAKEIAVEAAPETVAAEVPTCSTDLDHEKKDRHEEIYKILRESEPDSEYLKVPVRAHNHDQEEKDRHEQIYKILRESEPDSEYLQQHPGSHNQKSETENRDDLFQSAMAIVYKYSAVSAATGLIPVPLVDMAGFMATQLMMLKKLCKLYNIPFDTQRSKSAIAILASGINSAYLAASSSKLIPFIGAFSMAAMPAVNGALSYAVGRVFIQHFASGGTFLDFDPHKVRGYFEEQFRAGKVSREGK